MERTDTSAAAGDQRRALVLDGQNEPGSRPANQAQAEPRPDPATATHRQTPQERPQPAAGATFASPGASAARNGPIWRYAPAPGAQGGTLELSMIDGLLAVTVTPDNGKPAAVRLPAAASLEMRVALARTDLR